MNICIYLYINSESNNDILEYCNSFKTKEEEEKERELKKEIKININNELLKEKELLNSNCNKDNDLVNKIKEFQERKEKIYNQYISYNNSIFTLMYYIIILGIN